MGGFLRAKAKQALPIFIASFNLIAMSQRLQHLSAFDRHKRLMQEYVSYYGGHAPSAEQPTVKTDYETLKESYRYGLFRDDRVVRGMLVP